MDKAQPFSWKNLNTRRSFTASQGLGYPILVEEVLPGDSWHIKHSAEITTYPMAAPMRGSYKLQLSYFFVPTRLYTQSMDINRQIFDPSEVKFPTFNLPLQAVASSTVASNTYFYVRPNANMGICNGTLLDYLGFGAGTGNYYGYGTNANSVSSSFFTGALERYNATPVIGYFDIMRNYFLNTQESNFYWMSYGFTQTNLSGRTVNVPNVNVQASSLASLDQFLNYFVKNEAADFNTAWITTLGGNRSPVEASVPFTSGSSTPLSRVTDSYGNVFFTGGYSPFLDTYYFSMWTSPTGVTPMVVGAEALNNAGLCFVCHRPDMFTAWLSQASYSQMTSASNMDVSGGTLTMNQIFLDSHIYDYYQRGLLAGGRYADWVYAEFGVSNKRDLCIPQLLGVSSAGLGFNEITNSTQEESSDFATMNGLGGLAGRGIGFLNGYRQTFSSNEHGYLIAIFTIVPNVSYWQGTDPLYYKTAFGDVYAPALARIGFQTLPLAYLNSGPMFAGTNNSGSVIAQTVGGVIPAPAISPRLNTAIGYQPAWVEYTTAVNRSFSQLNGRGSLYYWRMNRSFGTGDSVGPNPFEYLPANPVTSYVLPSQVTSAFVGQGQNSQPFICDVNFNISCRRAHGKRVTPTLA